MSNPSAVRSKSGRPFSSTFSASKSHSASSPTLLSAMRRALTCSGVRSDRRMTGTVSMPSAFAARSRVCPVITTPSASTDIGWEKRKSLMLSFSAGIAASFFLGLFSYGLTSPTGTYSILRSAL